MAKKLLKKVLLLVLILGLFGCSNNSVNNISKKENNVENNDIEKKVVLNDKDIVILFTNDIHCGIEENVGFASFIKYFNDLKNEEVYKIKVDVGDFSQGDSFSAITKGQKMFEFMNKFAYDFIVPGNHEFDYGIDRFFENSMILNGRMFCANFYDIRTGETAFDPYKIFTFGNKKVALIGIISPDTLSQTSNTFFQDEKGEFIYSFSQENNGNAMYECIQKNIDECRNNGADYVILVGHLGEDVASKPYSSIDVINNTYGVDAMIDGHSHTKYNSSYTDKTGKEVLAAETGTKMQSFGKLTITKDGKIDIKLIDDFTEKDVETEKYIETIKGEANKELDAVMYKDNKIDLITNDLATGNRLIRKQETNLGDFATDAIRYCLGTDIAVYNGGGIRDKISKGDIKYNDVIKVYPFGKLSSAAEITGQILYDYLEFASMECPNEFGGFAHVSGITYEIDTTIPSSVKVDENGNFVNVDGEYRVKNIMINGEPLDVNKIYTIGSTNYLLKQYGDGVTMFKDAKIVKDDFMLDSETLINYFEVADMSKYENPYGEGRIKIIIE